MTGPGQAPGAISSNGKALRDRSLAAAHKEPSVVQTQMPWILHICPKELGQAPRQPSDPNPRLMPIARMAPLRLRLILEVCRAQICMAVLQV